MMAFSWKCVWLATALGNVPRAAPLHVTQSGGKPRALQSAAAQRASVQDVSLMTSNGARYLSFDQAAVGLEEFLRKEGVPGAVRFVPRSDLTIVGRRVYVVARDLSDARSRATREYEVAMRARLGVGLLVACRLKTADLVAYVYGPANADEAIRLMYPDGVKYSVPQDLREGVVTRWSAPVLRWLRRKVKSIREAQVFLK